MRARQPADLYEALVADGRAAADSADTDHEPFELDPGTGYRVGVGLPGHQLGPDDALVTIVEWSDFECPYCARNAPVLARVREKYGDQVRLVFRHAPMAMHRNAQLAAEAAVAAAEQGAFWPYHARLWASFGKLTRSDLEAHAVALGLDMARFRAALDERRFKNLVTAEAASAEALGVQGTPTMFVNAQPVVGSRAPEELDRIIDAHLANARQMASKGLPPRELYSMLMTAAVGADRADPASVPMSTLVHIELRADDRARAIVAACRRRNRARAAELAAGLSGDARLRAARVCAGEGIDL